MKLNCIAFIFSFFLIALLMSSCTREYTCRCTWSHSGSPGLPQGDVREYPITDSKKNAESKCKNNSRKYDDNGIETYEDCVLF